MNGLKIMCMKMQYLVFVDSMSFLPCSLCKLPEAFGLTASRSWFPYIYYGVNQISESESRDFLSFNECQTSEVFDNILSR